MRHAFTLTIQARGSLLIGGGDVPDGLHGAHAKGHDGNPIVPASALRGALRETLEALLRGADRPACDAGTGRPPGHADDAEAPALCTLDDGGPCGACRLFGGARNGLDAGARDFSALVLGDGVLASDAPRAWMVRPGVAVGRRQRSAAEKRLYLRRTTATGATFTAEGWLRDDALRRAFEAAVQATTHVGAGRSRGTARVELKVDWPAAAPQVIQRLPEGDVTVRVTLRTPTILGVPLAHGNLRDTRREIPGAALRGAIGFALANELTDPDHDAAFQALVHPSDGAHFGFLSPVERDVPTSNEPAGRLPITSLRCKAEPVAHGLHDDLFDRIAVALVKDVGQVAAVHGALRASACAKCKGPLRAAKGFRRLDGDPTLRVVTRASIDRRTASVRDRALFTEVYLEPGNVFEGTIRRVPATARDALAQGLSLPLSIGRARGAGRGQASVEVVEVAAPASIVARGEAFERALTEHLRRSKLPADRAGSLVPLTLLSPCVVEPVDGDEWEALVATLPTELQGTTPLVRARRFVREGTWDQRTGDMHPLSALASGAVYVLALPGALRWRDVVGALEAVERGGVGARTHQGYGEVYVFDPIHAMGGGGKG